MEHVLELRFALDTFYYLVCGALVMWMAAGFMMLEAGLVRAKNATEILTKNISLFCIAAIMYLLVGYAIMYGGPLLLHGIGQFDLASMLDASSRNGFGGDANYARGADFFFQVMFVATAMSVVSGAVAERMKLWVFLLFAMVMTAVLYPMEGAWTWGGRDVFGLFNLGELGFSDFAGSGVVHLAGATAALAAVLLLGPRRGKYNSDGTINAIPGSNLPLSALGTMVLWLGWFGFNAGSVFKLSDGNSANLVAMAFLNTHMAAVSGGVAALLMSRLLFGKADLTMLLNGVLAGLVVITADAVNPEPALAALYGALGGVLVVLSILGLDRLHIDDPVGAISVHGSCGILGLLLVPWANPDATLVGQLAGIAVIFLWIFLMSLLVWALLGKLIGLRASQEDEYNGLDVPECGMEAYPEFLRVKS